jgi:hypothetical protein
MRVASISESIKLLFWSKRSEKLLNFTLLHDNCSCLSIVVHYCSGVYQPWLIKGLGDWKIFNWILFGQAMLYILTEYNGMFGTLMMCL